MTEQDFRHRLRRLYIGQDKAAIRFQVALALVDLAIIAFFILGPYLRAGPSYLIIDYMIAAWIATELTARAIIARDLKDWLKRPII